MKKKSMFYITPQEGYLEGLTTGSDLSTMTVDICILCKRDKNESLVKRVFGYYTALYLLLRRDLTLDNYVDFISIDSFDFYPAVGLEDGTVSVIATVSIQWEKEYCLVH